MKTLKKNVIQAFSLAPGLDELKGNKLILVTATGIISGTMKDEKGNNTSSKIHEALLNEVVDNYGSENIDGNDGYLLLSDVTIHMTGNHNVTMPSLVVFYDQIIGVSFGSI